MALRWIPSRFNGAPAGQCEVRRRAVVPCCVLAAYRCALLSGSVAKALSVRSQHGVTMSATYRCTAV